MSVVESTIEGRYQVITRIASGGMGEVYRAHDAVLGREVAIKVLHPQFAGDRGFIDRFRREARAAAILNHPNVVGVYDWGSAAGTYFMVMEYVPGLNLRALLSEFERLEAVQVVEVAEQVLQALEHAHGHGIVHRDVKPENILITREGVIKVADFGLARAYADSHVSQSEGVVTGTVQYLSPEQIEGRPADPRTDLYSLGIVLFELLTGSPPFGGETSMAIAYRHLSDPVPAPSSLVPTVPPALDAAVLHATEKDPARRPASSAALRTEIALAHLALPEAETVAQLAARVPAAEVVPDDRAATVTIPRAQTRRARRMGRLRWMAAILAVLAVLGAGSWAAWVYAVPHYTHVPGVVGLPVEQATDRLEEAGLAFRIGPQVFSSGIESGLVVRTSPAGETRVRRGTEVIVIASKGPELLAIPDVKGRNEARARRDLEAAGFIVAVERAHSDEVREGRIIAQNPEVGQRIERGSEVTITVSRGPEPVEVPNVVGQAAGQGSSTLEAFGFEVRRSEQYSTEVASGRVITVDPPPGTAAPKGSAVTIVVSLGPRTFPMPDVVGMTRQEAVSELERLGLVVSVTLLPNTDPSNTVVFQSVPPNTTVKQGDVVTLYVTSS